MYYITYYFSFRRYINITFSFFSIQVFFLFIKIIIVITKLKYKLRRTFKSKKKPYYTKAKLNCFFFRKQK